MLKIFAYLNLCATSKNLKILASLKHYMVGNLEERSPHIEGWVNAENFRILNLRSLKHAECLQDINDLQFKKLIVLKL